MARTVIPVGDPKAVKIFSALLAKETPGQSFWVSKFAGPKFMKRGDGNYLSTDPNAPIQILRDLESAAGDTISFDLVAKLRGAGVEGDDQLAGKEEKLIFYTDEVKIDQKRHGVDTGGRMSKKRTVHDMRTIAKDMLSQWVAQWYDEVITCYAAGTRGIGTAQWLLPTDFTGHAGNALQDPDDDHKLVIAGGSVGTDEDSLASSDTFTRAHLEELAYKIKTMDNPPRPIRVGSEDRYLLILHPAAAKALREESGTSGWLEIQKAAGQRGRENPIFKDSLGEFGPFILHDYSKIPYFKNASSVNVARNLCFGAQSVVCAWGDAGGAFQFSWHEEMEDRGNVLVVDISFIFGCKKTRFNSKDFGVITVTTAI